MRTDSLLIAVMNCSPTTQDSLTRVVELSMTYLAQSTLFLLSAWVIPNLLRRLRILRSRPSPSIEEMTWKLAATLPLLTAPICQYADWSLLQWNVTAPVSEWRESTPIHDSVAAVSHNPAMAPRNVTTTTEFVSERPLVGANAVAGRSMSPAESETELPWEDKRRFPSVARALPIEASQLEAIAIVESELEPTNSLAIKPPVAAKTSAAVEENPGLGICGWCGLAILIWLTFSVVRLASKGLALELWLRGLRPFESDRLSEFDGLVPQGTRLLCAMAAPNTPGIALTRLLHAVRRRPGLGAAMDSERRLPCEQFCQPFACGLLRWTIVLPAGIDTRLSTPELRALLAHEAAHLIRRDPVWQWIGQFLCTCLALQPLNFLARRSWQRAAELLCDDWAVEHRVAPTLLANCLAQIAEWRLEKSAAPSLHQLGLPAVGSSGSFAGRIQWLLRKGRSAEPKRSHWRRAGTFAGLAAGLCLGISGPRLTLTTPVQAIQIEDVNDADRSVRDVLDEELSAIRSDLLRLQTQLNAVEDREITSMARNLLDRISTLHAELTE